MQGVLPEHLLHVSACFITPLHSSPNRVWSFQQRSLGDKRGILGEREKLILPNSKVHSCKVQGKSSSEVYEMIVNIDSNEMLIIFTLCADSRFYLNLSTHSKEIFIICSSLFHFPALGIKQEVNINRFSCVKELSIYGKTETKCNHYFIYALSGAAKRMNVCVSFYCLWTTRVKRQQCIQMQG